MNVQYINNALMYEKLVDTPIDKFNHYNAMYIDKRTRVLQIN